MNKIFIILLLVLLISATAFTQQSDIKPVAIAIPLTADEQREIVDLQTEIEKLQLMQQNSILRAANEHGVSLKKYNLEQQQGKLVFVPKPTDNSDKVNR